MDWIRLWEGSGVEWNVEGEREYWVLGAGKRRLELNWSEVGVKLVGMWVWVCESVWECVYKYISKCICEVYVKCMWSICEVYIKHRI